MDIRTFFIVPIRQLPPVAIAFIMAVGVSAFAIIQSLIFSVLFPLVHALTGLSLSTIRIDLSNNPRRGPFEDSVLLGPVLASLLAATILSLVLLKIVEAGRLWVRQERVECPYCLSLVPNEATKCSYCASDLFEDLEEAGGSTSPA